MRRLLVILFVMSFGEREKAGVAKVGADDPRTCAGQKPRTLNMLLHVKDAVLSNVIASSGSMRPAELLETYFLAYPERRRALHELSRHEASGRSKNPGVLRLSAEHDSYEDWFERALQANHPAVISDLVSDWKAFKEWIKEDGKLDPKGLIARCGGQHLVDVVSTSTGVRSKTQLGVFLEEWGSQSGYLKDWHYRLDGAGEAAPTPKWFRDDWLNEYLVHVGVTDYHFIYLGPKSSRTLLHADVLNTYSWSVNVCGRKRWLLLPPEQTHLLYDEWGEETARDFFTRHEARHDARRFPNLRLAKPLEVIQLPGEAIFVPAGWFHTVENLDDEVLSVNCNWLNACNLRWALARIQRDAAMEVRATAAGGSKGKGKGEGQQLVQGRGAISAISFAKMLKFKAKQLQGLCGDIREHDVSAISRRAKMKLDASTIIEVAHGIAQSELLSECHDIASRAEKIARAVINK